VPQGNAKVTARKLSTQDRYPKFLDDQRQFFDEIITHDWRTYESPAWNISRGFEVDCLFRLVSPRTILDVGCGCGFHDVLMAEKPGVQAVTGIDYSEKSIETANRVYSHPNVRRYVKDICGAQPQATYDLVVSFQVIEHLSDPVTFLADCARQSSPGGSLAVVTPNRMRIGNCLRTLAGKPPKLGDPQHYREYVAAELIEFGNKIGLEYFAGFSCGLSPRVPKFGWPLMPARASLRLGYLLPSIADCFCVVFKSKSPA
jgi:2-polyprenyl-3-methyl-5-hydroxy-6-metoxy-1,4-benzoquinol methylase